MTLPSPLQVLDFVWTVADAASSAAAPDMTSVTRTRSELSIPAFALSASHTYSQSSTLNPQPSNLNPQP